MTWHDAWHWQIALTNYIELNGLDDVWTLIYCVGTALTLNACMMDIVLVYIWLSELYIFVTVYRPSLNVVNMFSRSDAESQPTCLWSARNFLPGILAFIVRIYGVDQNQAKSFCKIIHYAENGATLWVPDTQ